MRGWRLFLVPPLTGLGLALSLGGLMRLSLISSAGAGWVLGFALFAVLPAMAGALYGARDAGQRPGWARSIVASWPSVMLIMVALAGFGGTADLMTSLYGAGILGVASLACVMARLAFRHLKCLSFGVKLRE